VAVVTSGRSAISYAQAHAVDILLIDYAISDMSALSCIETIRAGAKNLPIIVTCAKQEPKILMQIIAQRVHHFLYKPFELDELNERIESCARIAIANQFLIKERKEKQRLEEERAYKLHQEEISFRKELVILRNDFYYQRHLGKRELLIDFLYMPLDTLSGDAYSARRVDLNRMFFFIVDGMGAGLSASLSAMMLTTYVNHKIDVMMASQTPFTLETLVRDSIAFIQKALFDEEVISAEFICIDEASQRMYYALFSMPALLLQESDTTLHRIYSNNPPINKYHNEFRIDFVELHNIKKLLFYSDGLIESAVKEKEFSQYIADDFVHSFTREAFKQRMFERVTQQKDDMTFIFLNYLDYNQHVIQESYFDATLAGLDEANAWYEAKLHALGLSTKKREAALLSFSELFMNAFEHGSLGVDSLQKEELIAQDIYLEFLQNATQDSSKKILVTMARLEYLDHQSYLITNITDQGRGFDTQILSTIFRNREKFNGKGVYISRKASQGIYYNRKGNSVLFLHPLN